MTTVTPVAALPDDLDALRALALAEEFTALEWLVRDFESGENRFDRDGEALFVARQGGRLVGICGLNIDPFVEGDDAGSVGRVRRLFVDPAVRRNGVGVSLVEAVRAASRDRFRVLRLRTYDPGADAFYRAIGFAPVDGQPHATHAMSL